MIEKKKQVKSVRKAPSGDTVLKALNRCAKTIKTQLILKTTKKLQELSNCEGDSDKEKKKEELLRKLKQLKGIDHQKIGIQLSKEKFPKYFVDEVYLGNVEDADIELFRNQPAQKKIDECCTDLAKKLSKDSRAPRTTEVQRTQSSQTLRKRKAESTEENTSNPEVEQALRLRKSKLSHAGKIAKKKAVFMDSLSGDNDSGSTDNMDPYERARLEKSIRNRINRTKNRAIREKEKQEQMAIYGPDAEKKHDEIRKEYRKSRRPNEENSSSPSRGHSEDQQPKRDRFRKPVILSPPKLIAATKPIIDNAKKDELEFMAKRGKEWKETGVHPSWAAKKINQAPTILPSQGKKIVFED